MEIKIRKGEKRDLTQIHKLIVELAIYERAANEVTVTLDELERDGFGQKPLFEVLVAESSKSIVGMAFYYYSYSTWKGRCIYLEDIVVLKEHRGKGIGEMLFNRLIGKAKKFGAKRLSWQVLDWNEPAINFYKKFNAGLDPEWLNGRLTEKEIEKLSK